jgi:hypothetical protein
MMTKDKAEKSLNLRATPYQKTEIVKLAYQQFEGNITEAVRVAIDRLLQKGVAL